MIKLISQQPPVQSYMVSEAEFQREESRNRVNGKAEPIAQLSGGEEWLIPRSYGVELISRRERGYEVR